MTADIEKMKALALAATPSPWVTGGTTITTHKGCNGSWWELCSIMMSPEGKRPHWQAAFVRDQSNADYIAACHPAAVLELIAEVGLMTDELVRLRDWFESQRKAISKGAGSTWDMCQCSDQIERIDAAIAAHTKVAKAQGDCNG